MKDVMNVFNEYLSELKKIDIVNQNEHTGRTQLENLLNAIKSKNIQVRQEEKGISKLSTPDYTVNHTQKHTVIGYIENKKVDENLSNILKSKQIEKYKKLSENIILTDYLEWIWIDKDKIKRARLCNSQDLENPKFKLNKNSVEGIYNLIQNFYSQEAEKITKVKELAQKLARPSIELKKYIIEQIDNQVKDESERADLYALYETFRNGLFEDLPTKDFADGFAQMLTYAIFLAKLNTNETLSLRNCKDHIPQAFSLIKTLVRFLDLLNEDGYKPIQWAVENILSVINNIDSLSITENLNYKHSDSEKDAYIYFYEDFLKEYDQESRVDRGVYYTPPAVVQFIVTEVSNILEQDFNLSKGLANQKVKLLDFACGTGTFLFESYKQILQNTAKDSFERNELIENHILKNLFGFEIMISSYIISHLKLSQFLKEKGYDIAKKENRRVQVYLTNTLENKKDYEANLFATAVAEEGKKAKEIKDDNDIIAIIGNPPYNISSQNKLHKENELFKFHENYKPRDEKSFNLDDDYIKFISFAHNKINKSGKGVIGVIVNNSFLKGLTHRKMRCELMKDFDKIYIINLHGNARIGETAEDGGIDQNVFDIMQGVCVCLFVKNKDITDKGVYQIDLYGKRKEKFKILYKLDRNQLQKLEIEQFNKDFRSTRWGKERFQDDLSFFSPMKGSKTMLEYGKFWGLTDVFGEYSSGVETHRDNITIRFSQNECKAVVNDFINLTEQEVRRKYLYNQKTGKYHEGTGDWQVLKAKKDIINSRDKDLYQKISYRPFDTRCTYYTGTQGFIGRPRKAIMQHMLKGDNLGLVFPRNSHNKDFDSGFVSNCIIDAASLAGSKTYLAPLYLCKQDDGSIKEKIVKIKNFKPTFKRMIAERFNNPTPEEILGYIYASLHSPNYRKKYLELLKIDFPRINFDISLDEFKRLSAIGQELIDAHLMKKIPDLPIGSCICSSGFDNIEVKKPIYNEQEERLYVNKECYFDSVELNVWEFKIGGYQVIDKYLKSRKERVLSKDEIENIINIIKILSFTIEKMSEIDRI